MSCNLNVAGENVHHLQQVLGETALTEECSNRIHHFSYIYFRLI